MLLPRHFTAWLTINRACNLRCGWCYGKAMDFATTATMSMETVRAALAMFDGLAMDSVILIGGEPTIHPRFLDIVRTVRAAGYRPLVVTNSVRFRDDRFLGDALRAGLCGITTSLKAGDDEQYERLTGRRVFSLVMQAIRNIEARRSGNDLFHKLSITICDGVLQDFDRILDAVVASGAERFSLDMERPILIGGQTQSPGSTTPREMADFFVRVYPKLEACGMRFTMKISLPFCLFPAWFITELVTKGRLVSGCQMLRGSGIIVDHAGRVLPCNQFCDHPLGEIGVDFTTAAEYLSFREGSVAQNFYGRIASCPDQRCVECAQWKFCGAGCRMQWLHRGADELLGRPTSERR